MKKEFEIVNLTFKIYHTTYDNRIIYKLIQLKLKNLNA